MARKFIVGGNWKMNGNKALVDQMSEVLNTSDFGAVEVLVAPPAPLLPIARAKFASAIGVSAQNAHQASSGAYTGELSVELLKDISIDWVILGHSERREIYKESNQLIGEKVAFALKNNLKVIACIGEKLEERKANETMNVIVAQLQGITSQITADQWDDVVLAYEPVWAIGTGVVATPEQAQETHQQIRAWISSNVSPAVASAVRIMYGGSVNAKNCGDLQKQPDIDGFLVGGASLKPQEFLTICRCRL